MSFRAGASLSWYERPWDWSRPFGDGTHKLPVKKDIRRTIGKNDGDTVTIHLT